MVSMNNAVHTDTAALDPMVRIGQIMKGRTLASFTSGEWDHIICLIEKHIAECQVEHRDEGVHLSYAYGPQTRAKFDGYRTRARRREARRSL